MQLLLRTAKAAILLGAFALSSHLALEYGSGGLWHGMRAAHAVVSGKAEVPYDLTQLRAVNPTLEYIQKKYVEPERVDPRQMLLGALDQIQKEVAQVIVTHEERQPTVTVRVFEHERRFRVDNVQGHWDVPARLLEIFGFLQEHLRGKDVDLAEVEYAAANGMLRTLDPHSVFLSPEDYRDMNVATSGHFGGLGIVISVRDQQLTVMRPMPGTPADKVGLRRMDRITKINNESTLNMPLEDAVSRLRGDPGTKVTIWVHRDGDGGWSGSRPFELEREVIRVSSVDRETLSDGIGYVRIKQFQQTTADELKKALAQLSSKRPLAGLVLDLRDDPGGLLDQAGKVADMFIAEGVLYTTVGNSDGRHEQRATRAGTEPNYPIVVLVSEGSASASEIVAGALKNQNRAVIAGSTTFGKGSVQLVFPDITPEKAALKLTIAQYLTPGDISIQGKGVTPDVALVPMTADTLEMNLFENEVGVRESDLTKTLGAGGKRDTEPSRYVLRYALPESVRAEIRDRGSVVDDDFRIDAPIRLAASLLGAMRSGTRPEQLDQLKSHIEKLEAKEMTSVETDLRALGIDWRAAPADYKDGPEPADVKVTVETDRPSDTVDAGQPMNLTVRVENRGKLPLYRLYGLTKSDAGYYDQRELVFGAVMPGESRAATVPLGFCAIDGVRPGSTKPLPEKTTRVCRLPHDAITRQDVVKVRFFAQNAEPPHDVELRPTVKSLPRPVFAYDYQVVDNRAANDNSQLERGEGATVYLRVRNVGAGPSLETQANLRNLTGDGLLLRAGRFDLSGLQPGEERDVEFTFDVLPNLAEPEIRLHLSIADIDTRAFAAEKLVLSVADKKTALKPTAATGQSRASVEADVLAAPSERAPVVGRLSANAIVSVRATFGSFTQVVLGGARTGFVRTRDLAATKEAAPAIALWKPSLSHAPPRLSVTPPALATRDTKIRIEGEALAPAGVSDAFAFVGSRKVFYAPNSAASLASMKFSFDAELAPGINVITVVARQTEDTSTRETFVIRRDGPGGEPLATPASELLGEGWEFGER